MSKFMPLKPRMSEKSFGMSKTGIYVFEVPKSANKMTIAEAVTDQFGVTVETVNIVVSKGKEKRTYKRGGRPIIGYDNDVKKAYVRLKEGAQIPVFAAIEEEEAQEQKAAEKAAKKASKEEKK